MSITPLGDGITAPKGYQAAGVACGIKSEGKLDLAVLASQVRCTAAAVFTANRLKGASLLVGQENLHDQHAQAVVVNSGNANACTGERGLLDAQEMCRTLGRLMSIPAADVIPSSTGVIGVYLPLPTIREGIQAAHSQLSREGGSQMAHAIMTTDTVPKESAYKIVAGGQEVRIGGCAKGAGMIHPNMATMLCFLTTDARVSPDILHAWLKDAVDQSFNRISVDGETSCDDTVLILANGLCGGETVHSEDTELGAAFKRALNAVCWDLARALVKDGEGVNRTMRITVRGAKSQDDADRAARGIAVSPLVKTAIAGGDPNWGRIINAAGYSGADFDPGAVTLWIGDVKVMESGVCARFDEAAAAAVFQMDEFEVVLDLNAGRAESWYYTSDLTHGYVDINADYTHRT